MAIVDLLDDCVQVMDEDEIRMTLSNHTVGVLGVPTSGPPILRPVSYQYDAPEDLNFAFVGRRTGNLQRACRRADVARFLVYRATSPFYWQSVICTGPIRVVEDDRWRDGDRFVDRPAVFERAAERADVTGYTLRLEDCSGIKGSECPPGFEPSVTEDPDR